MGGLQRVHDADAAKGWQRIPLGSQRIENKFFRDRSEKQIPTVDKPDGMARDTVSGRRGTGAT